MHLANFLQMSTRDKHQNFLSDKELDEILNNLSGSEDGLEFEDDDDSIADPDFLPDKQVENDEDGNISKEGVSEDVEIFSGREENEESCLYTPENQNINKKGKLKNKCQNKKFVILLSRHHLEKEITNSKCSTASISRKHFISRTYFKFGNTVSVLLLFIF